MSNTSRIFPSTTIGLSLIGGFAFMLLVDPIIHRASSNSHHTSQHTPLPSSDPGPSTSNGHVEFDVELGELEREQGIVPSTAPPISYHPEKYDVPDTAVAYPLTLGLTVHALADGLALGSSAVSPLNGSLSFVVFIALIIHKGTDFE